MRVCEDKESVIAVISSNISERVDGKDPGGCGKKKERHDDDDDKKSRVISVPGIQRLMSAGPYNFTVIVYSFVY